MGTDFTGTTLVVPKTKVYITCMNHWKYRGLEPNNQSSPSTYWCWWQIGACCESPHMVRSSCTTWLICDVAHRSKLYLLNRRKICVVRLMVWLPKQYVRKIRPDSTFTHLSFSTSIILFAASTCTLFRAAYNSVGRPKAENGEHTIELFWLILDISEWANDNEFWSRNSTIK